MVHSAYGVIRLFRFPLALVALCKILLRNEIFLGATSADSFHLSVSKNGVTQMFIIAAARKGKNVGGILLLLASAAGSVCINLNGNCGDVSLASPTPLSRILPSARFSSFFNNSPLFAVCYPEELFLFPAASTTYFRLVPS